MTFSLSEIGQTAKKFLEQNSSHKVFAFYGEMGSGKTTFIKALCNQLGVADVAVSPTFSLINEYHTEKGEKIFHFDFYRIKNETEALDMGVEEYFYSGCYCFIEWPEKIEALLPENTVKVRIKSESEKRNISLI